MYIYIYICIYLYICRIFINILGQLASAIDYADMTLLLSTACPLQRRGWRIGGVWK